MQERPIIFSGPMVRAILDGKKTQMRRVVKWRPREEGLNLGFSGLELDFYMRDEFTSGWVLCSRDGSGCWNDRTWPAHCPYGEFGNRLWVRETWALEEPSGIDYPLRIMYRADKVRRKIDPDSVQWEQIAAKNEKGGWRPSIHMPRWASRITLEITAVRVERLHDITERDAIDEGVEPFENEDYDEEDPGEDEEYSYVSGFAELWNTTNQKRGYGWDTNPWVWVVSFRKVE